MACLCGFIGCSKKEQDPRLYQIESLSLVAGVGLEPHDLRVMRSKYDFLCLLVMSNNGLSMLFHANNLFVTFDVYKCQIVGINVK